MFDSLQKILEQDLAKHVGTAVSVINFKSIGGGCINNAQKIETSAGPFFIKTNDAARYPGMFEAEAMGLALLQSAGAIRVPGVITCGKSGGQSYILLEYINSGNRNKRFWENFGHALANLHQQTADQFGLDHDNYIGSLQQFNRKHHSWNSFFIEQRLEPQVKLAIKHNRLSQTHSRQFHSLYNRLKDFFPDEPPALLHGDLWSGNFMTAESGEACLIDPAVYYGHREMELAFTQLFGGFDERFYQSYHESFPLKPGFVNRMDICNLYPLLVHVNLFAGGYISSVESILQRYA